MQIHLQRMNLQNRGSTVVHQRFRILLGKPSFNRLIRTTNNDSRRIVVTQKIAKKINEIEDA